VPELSNAITLRGAVVQPSRQAWKPGMRVSDVIQKKSVLMTQDTVRRQNETLFDQFEQERTARGRARVPADLAAERVLLDKGPNALGKNAQNISCLIRAPCYKLNEAPANKTADPEKPVELTDRDVAIAQLGRPTISEESLAERVGQLSRAGEP
jgi:hypothetical protein